MEVIAYNSEKHERGHLRYILFAIFFTALIVLMIVTENYVGAVVLFFLLWGYLFFSIANTKPIKLLIADEALYIGTKPFGRNRISGFAIEIDNKSAEIKNIIFLYDNQKLIHTFSDEKAKIKEFVVTLSDRLPMTDQYQQTSAEKLIRRLKL